MRLLPKSLFGRLVLVLISGLTVAQLLSAVINFAERDQLLLRASGMQSAQRIADTIKLFDSLEFTERQRIANILSIPPQMVTLAEAPLPDRNTGTKKISPTVSVFSADLHAALGDDRTILVVQSGSSSSGWSLGFARGLRSKIMGTTSDMGHLPAGGMFFQVQVHLQDGSWAIFETHVQQEAARLSGRLLLTLAVLLTAVLFLSLIAVRWVTRPLHMLAVAAEELGNDINRSPLPENGPQEVKQAAHAFNTMQRRLARFIQDRTRILAAMSHDLKTPITRMRLRADLLEDDDLRRRFEKDLKEMEFMVTDTLEFMRGIASNGKPQQIDIMALIESLQADNEEMGREVTVQGKTSEPFVGMAQLLKRCLSNLIDNAILYGGRVCIQIEDEPKNLILRFLDEGPGIPPSELETVFEPFYRLESSRSRETGGTGLGLTIARNIAQTHGGDIHLCNRSEGGLEAILILPRREIRGSGI